MQLKSLLIPISSEVVPSFAFYLRFSVSQCFANSVMLTMFTLQPIGGVVIRRRGVSLLTLPT